MRKADRITIGIIFERIKDQERFTDDALLFQKILLFSLLGADHQFFIKWEMCKWLKKNHKPFEKRSVVGLQQLVARKIEKLLDLQLIHEIGTQPISTTTTGLTPIYSFHLISYLLGWLIESLSTLPARRTEATNKIFNILLLMSEPTELDAAVSTNVFFNIYIKKSKQDGVIEDLVRQMIGVLESDNIIKDASDIVSQTLLFRNSRPDIITKFNQLWEETFNELEPHLKELFMFRLKLQYENEMKLNAQDAARFEQSRYAARERFDKLVVECSCLSCPRVTYEMIDLLEYMTKLRYHIAGYSALRMDCSSCGAINSLQITDL